MKNINEYSPKDWKPKLFINNKITDDEEALIGFQKEIKDYSITPTTFQSRAFKNKFDESIFTEQYEFK